MIARRSPQAHASHRHSAVRLASAKFALRFLAPCSGFFASLGFPRGNEQVISRATPLSKDGCPAAPKGLPTDLASSQSPFQHSKKTIVTADPTFVRGIDDLDVIEAQAMELLAILHRPADMVRRDARLHGVLMPARNKDVREDEPSARFHHSLRLAQKVIAGIEMKRRLDAHHGIERRIWKIELRGIHEQKLAARSVLPAALELLFRNVDAGDVFGGVEFGQVTRRSTFAARHIEERAFLFRNTASQFFHEVLAR